MVVLCRMGHSEPGDLCLQIKKLVFACGIFFGGLHWSLLITETLHR